MDNIIMTVFHTESEAYQAFAEITTAMNTNSSMISQAALVHKEKDAIQVKQFADIGSSTVDDTIGGGLLGALIGILGGPVGILIGGSVGTLVGAAVDTCDSSDSSSMIAYVADKMENGHNALILLAQETDEKLIDARFARYDVSIRRWDAGEVAQQIEEACKLQEELQRQARRELREKKSAERKAKVEAHKQRIAEQFEAMRAGRNE